MKNRKIVICILSIIIVTLFIWKVYPSLKRMDFHIKYDSKLIKIGEQELIEYEIESDNNVQWKSLNENIAVVSGDTVTGVGLGETIIEGTITKNNKVIKDSFKVSTYLGNPEISLNSVIFPEGELFITKGDTYEIPIEYNPLNAYITSVDYSVNNPSIIKCDGKIHAINIGVTYVTIIVNKTISKDIIVHVIDKKIDPSFSKNIQNIIVDDISLNVNEVKTIKYSVEPENSFVESVELESSNPNIVYIKNNSIVGKTPGTATIKLTINKNVVKEIKVLVNTPITDIKLASEPIVMKVGDKMSVVREIIPSNATNKILYTSSNSKVLSIDENGNAVALSRGTGTISLKSEDGNYQKNVSFTVNPTKGLVTANDGVWGYSSVRDEIPIRASNAFFINMATSGKGIISGDVYTYTDSNHIKYSYDIARSVLQVDGYNILVRFYYPQKADLSTTNTFTFFGGSGELGFGGYFDALNNDTSGMISSGIIILVSTRGDYNSLDGMYATNFIRSIVDQKKDVKNAVGGYSLGGNAAAKAANDGIYDRLIIFDSYINNVQNYYNLKSKEITFYSPLGDSLTDKTMSSVKQMINSGYKNITIVSNNSSIIQDFANNILVINPGKKMGQGHYYVNICPTKVFSYACR